MSASSREILYEDAAMRVSWDASAKLLELEAKSTPAPGQFRPSLERVLQYIKQKKARKVLADISKMDKLSGDDLVWTETDWFPRELKAGAKLFAVVPPASLMPHMSLDKMAERVDPSTTGHARRFFADAASAREWLARQ